MLIAFWPKMVTRPTKIDTFFNRSSKPFLAPKLLLPSKSRTHFSFKSNFGCDCIKKEIAQGFSALPSDIPWERGDTWIIMAMYMLSLHIPLGIGGLSIAAYLLHRPVLHPQTQVLSLLIIQIFELAGALILLRLTAKTEHELLSFFNSVTLSKERNPMLASALGFGFLIVLVFITSAAADMLFGAKDVSIPILKEILASRSSNVSKTACFLVYCVITPILEEIMYRGFLLTSLASTMTWQRAVFLSSVVFGAAHFSGESFFQLFIVGCVLGCCYCWSGNLKSSIAVHSLYNAVTLIIILAS